jgi:4-hydroxy 2-oxovalerate aldolase
MEVSEKKVIVLDCTLRDGGYFNDWRFDRTLAQNLVAALSRAGVNIVEVGFKSPHTHREKGFEGLFRYCNESELGFLRSHRNLYYSFMVDAKEFLRGNQADPSLVDECIPEKGASLFSYARIATYFPNFQGSVDLASLLHGLGYRVTLNLMGMSLLGQEHLDQALDLIRGVPLEVFYFSDSFGDLQPGEIVRFMHRIREKYGGRIGIHTHDNNGLAFANTIAALEHGIDVIDATLMGMGRGAGNLRTEQILLYLYFKKGYTHLNPAELLEVVDLHLAPLKKTFQWGWDYTYMLSALQNIHPTYCQNLRASNQYTIDQVSKILNSIEPSRRSAFDERALLAAIDNVINQPVVVDEALAGIPLYEPEPWEKVLVIGTGPGREVFRSELAAFIDQHDPLVIECNPMDTFYERRSRHYLRAILNWMRLRKALARSGDSSSPIVTGLWGLPISCGGKADVRKIPCHVGKDGVSVSRDGMTLPAYVVGMFAVGLAILSAPHTIYVAGYDGYADRLSQSQQEMEHFWKVLSPPCPIVSITPTSYTLTTESVYRHIK